MKNQTKLILVLVVVLSFLSSGCSTKMTQIENNKQENLKNNINLSSANGFKAYINQNNELKYLCFQDYVSSCNYETDEKHSYGNGTPEEEYFWVNSDGYYPNISPSTKNVQCGVGSLWGWLAIFNSDSLGSDSGSNIIGTNAITNYNKKNPKECNSRYTKLDSTQIGDRLGVGLLTFLTPLLTGGTMHTVKFDHEEFIDSIYISNIETFRSELIHITSQYDIEGGLDVIYLKQGDIKDQLDSKYESLLIDSSRKAGVIFIEEKSNKLLAISIFDKFKNENLIESISLQISELLNALNKDNSLVLQYDDITPYIPDNIPLPRIPAIPVLVKDEFEKKSTFNKRVENAVAQREKEIRNLQRQYSLDVYERNNYIDNLQQSYKFYLAQKAEEKNELLKELKENITDLSKVLFLENTSGFQANNFKYDAESEKLYFDIYSRNEGFSQEVVSAIPTETAKRIKQEKSFKIIPDIKVVGNSLQLAGFNILEPISNESYEVQYTNINFKPEMVSVSVVGMKESIQKEINNHFKQYKQQDATIVDTSKKEIWYIDIANSINAKVPDWFSNPSTNNKIIGYGEGDTLNEAKANARNDLSFMVKVKVNSVFENTGSINTFRTFNDTKIRTQQSSTIELNASDYKVLKQDSVDGRWYVGLEYISTITPLSKL